MTDNCDYDIAWTTAGGDLGPEAGQLTVENSDHAFLTPVNITALIQQWVDGSTPNYGLILDKGTMWAWVSRPASMMVRMRRHT